MTSPGFSEAFSQPLAAIRLVLGPPTFHFSTLPLASATSMPNITCGLPQLYEVRVPLTVTSFEESTGQE